MFEVIRNNIFRYVVLVIIIWVSCSRHASKEAVETPGLHSRDSSFDATENQGISYISNVNIIIKIDSLAKATKILSLTDRYYAFKQLLETNALLVNPDEEKFLLFPDRFDYASKEVFFTTLCNEQVLIYYYSYQDTLQVQNVKNNWMACYAGNCENLFEKQPQSLNKNDLLTAYTLFHKKSIFHVDVPGNVHSTDSLDKAIRGISEIIDEKNSKKILTFNFNKYIIK